jgi:hypothetical protein
VNTTRWFCLGLVVVLLPFLGKPPVADEESYLFMASSIADHPLSPYDWWRNWQPWGEEAQSNSFHFAHPPLHLWWVSFWRSLVGEGPLLRLAAGLPWVILFGVSASKLAQKCTGSPGLALTLALCSPVLVLGLHDSLMIDLGALSLCTAAVAVYRLALVERGQFQPAFALGAGLLLGLASSYKYPSLVLVPLLFVHLWRLNLLGQSARLWLGFGLVFFGLQAFLFSQYGEFHLFSAIASASEIDRSPFLERTAGLMVRLGFAVCPLVIFTLAIKRAHLVPAVALAGLSVGILGRGDLNAPGLSALFILATTGILFSFRAAIACLALTSTRQRQQQRDDGLLLGGWALLVVLSIIFGHNYADPRYLLPAILPLCLLVARSAEQLAGGKNKLRLAAGIWGGVALVTALSDFHLAKTTDRLASEIVATESPLRFSAEWTARYRLEKNGWKFWHPSEALAPGDRVVVFSNAGAASPPEGAVILSTHAAKNRFPIRVLDWRADAGYHSEQLGRLPIAWGHSPLVVARIFQIPSLP